VWSWLDVAQALLQRQDFLAAVIVCYGFALTTVRTQVGAKQGATLRLIQQNSVPIVGKVGGLEHLQAMRAEFDHALVRNHLGGAAGQNR
jgi:hypothetical protein